MSDEHRTKDELRKELRSLRARLLESERHLAAARTRESSSSGFASGSLDAADAAIFIFDEGSRVVWTNRAVEKFFDRTRDQVIGLTKDELIVQHISPSLEDPEEFSRRALAPHAPMTQFEKIDCRVKVGGQPRPRMLEYHSEPIRSGPFAGGRIDHYYDVTELRRAEEHVHKSLEKLSEVAEEQKFILENMRDFVYRHDTEGVFYYLSPGIEAMTGYSLEDWKKHYTAYLTDHPCNQEAILFTEETLRSGVSRPPYRVEIRHQEGQAIMLEVSERPYFEDGKVAGIIGVARDVTDRERAKDEREALERRVLHAQKLESLGVLAGGIAHDFNNLLVGILGNAELARSHLQPEDPGGELIDDIKLAAQRAAELCRQMLAYSGRGHFLIEPIDVSSVVREMTEMTQASISKRASVELDLDEAPPSIEADVTQVRQVLLNLIVNASEALEDQDGTIRIRTGSERCSAPALRSRYLHDDLEPGQYVFIEVSDTGSGMDEQTLTRLFDPFYTTKFTGRGLGLSAALGIIRGHKGTIDLDSALGEGTTVRVLFPAAESQVPAQATSAEATTGALIEGTILVVDDEPVVRKVTARMLKRLGLRVLTADNGRVALEVCAQNADKIRCCILDLTMPEMDGEESLRELRKHHPGLPIILSSGYDATEITERLGDRGAVHYLQKPYTAATLQAAVSEAMGAST